MRVHRRVNAWGINWKYWINVTCMLCIQPLDRKLRIRGEQCVFVQYVEVIQLLTLSEIATGHDYLHILSTAAASAGHSTLTPSEWEFTSHSLFTANVRPHLFVAGCQRAAAVRSALYLHIWACGTHDELPFLSGWGAGKSSHCEFIAACKAISAVLLWTETERMHKELQTWAVKVLMR